MDGTEDDWGRWVVRDERTLYDNPWVRLGKADITTPSSSRFENHTVPLAKVRKLRSEEHPSR